MPHFIKSLSQVNKTKPTDPNITDSFNSNVGVRQGDNLSPNLFKLFINDLPEIFDQTCNPVILNKDFWIILGIFFDKSLQNKHMITCSFIFTDGMYHHDK
jgi:hypothetical protein